MNKKNLYKRAYRLMENSTPLKFDCGMLCNSKCCTGDSRAGMSLFHGEEAMLDVHGGFLAIRKERKILNSFSILIWDKDIRDYVRLLSSVLDEYKTFLG